MVPQLHFVCEAHGQGSPKETRGLQDSDTLWQSNMSSKNPSCIIYIDSFSIKTPIYGGFPIATFDYKQPVIAKAGWGQSHQQGKETAQRPKPGPLSHPELVVFAMETNLVGGFIIYIYHYILVGGIPTL